jgi:hypothetical protein
MPTLRDFAARRPILTCYTLVFAISWGGVLLVIGGHVSSAAEFRDFAEPGFAKTIYALSVRALDLHRTLLSGVMRTATTDEQARDRFRRYWTFKVGSGAHVLVNGLLDVTREMAEQKVALHLEAASGLDSR